MWDLILTCLYSRSTTCTHVGFEVDVFVLSFHYMHSCGIWSWRVCTLVPLHELMRDWKLTCLYSRSTTCTHVGFEVDVLVLSFHYMHSCGIWSWRACCPVPLHVLMWNLKLTCMYSRSLYIRCIWKKDGFSANFEWYSYISFNALWKTMLIWYFLAHVSQIVVGDVRRRL